MSTAAMQNLFTYIQSLGLSRRNRKWLAEKLIEPLDVTETAGYKEAMDDIRHGRVTTIENLDEYFKKRLVS